MIPLLTEEPIDSGAVLAQVAGDHLGGTVLFLGTVRRSEEDGPVEAIDYSAYGEMVSAESARILAEMSEQYPGARAVMQHRVGRIRAGEASIAVAASAPHRDEAFAAARFVIEEVKVRLPVWKKELLDDGKERWRANRPDDTEASG